ncbi:hypothetical protein KC867_02585 [Candidatus Saccharibacteria bacterium]|nr:hypothetical protein [Candidatus Saccharibacteria bacterium]
MKQQDIAVVIIIVFFVGIGSYFLSSKIISPAEPMKSYDVSTINGEFDTTQLNGHINSEAFDPTVRIYIGPEDINEEPFTGDAD